MSTEQEKQERGKLQHEAEHERPRKRNSVLLYLVILFAAAFLLLLLSYFSQQRDSQDVLSTMETLEEILRERDALKEQTGQLEESLAEAQAQLSEAQDQLDELPDVIRQQEHVLEETCRAMDYFWQVNEAYVRGRYTLCRELIAAMEDASGGQTPLKDYLPAESATDNDRFSPADRYQEIYDAVM